MGVSRDKETNLWVCIWTRTSRQVTYWVHGFRPWPWNWHGFPPQICLGIEWMTADREEREKSIPNTMHAPLFSPFMNCLRDWKHLPISRTFRDPLYNLDFAHLQKNFSNVLRMGGIGIRFFVWKFMVRSQSKSKSIDRTHTGEFEIWKNKGSSCISRSWYVLPCTVPSTTNDKFSIAFESIDSDSAWCRITDRFRDFPLDLELLYTITRLIGGFNAQMDIHLANFWGNPASSLFSIIRYLGVELGKRFTVNADPGSEVSKF